jgi:DNA-binding GntR family transcriptional regulator
MKNLKSKNLTELVYEELLGRITDGVLKDGQSIVIDRFAKEFNISLNPVREALAKLNVEGIVQYEQNKGYRVAPKPSEDEYKNLFEARLVIETSVVRRGIKKVSDDFIRELDEINARLAKCKSGKTFKHFKDFVEINDIFHIKLLSLLENPSLIRAYEALGYSPQSARDLVGAGITKKDLENTVLEHDEIISAFKKKKLKLVEDAIERHIMSGYERFVERTTD